eukprot:TRINITY_DN8193_c0_g1_i2.p1 TRINITY_DN8193_c0_g1~~TRINITY_DN8193_c0_g1_i2.p1  ORF type:complete len:208 (-),score=75.65 TRINITY_DN8193_c0_g1_i2:189-812(-)
MNNLNVRGRQVEFLSTKKGSLNDEERGWVEEVCEDAFVHYAAIAKLFTANGNTWDYTGVIGGLVLLSEANLQNVEAHYLRIVDLKAWSPHNALSFEQEFYQNFVYYEVNPWLHVFEMNEGIAALSFANENEAKEFLIEVEKCKVEEPKEFLKNKVGKAQMDMISYPSVAQSGIHTGKQEKIVDAIAPGNRKNSKKDKKKKKKKKGFF